MARLKQTHFVGLGDRAKDMISGFVGIVTGETNWLYGCRRLGVQAEKPTKDGSLRDIQWFDEGQLRLIRASVIKPFQAEAEMSAGGPTRSEETR